MNKQTVSTNWQSANLAAIKQRISSIRNVEHLEKVIPGEMQGIFLRKIGTVLEFYCYDNETQKISNIMSRIDLDNPLNLMGEYSQAVFMSAFWRDTFPENIYIAGYGGGRLAMLFNHYFPNVTIHGSDIDPNVLMVAKDYFGLGEAALEDIFAIDSREDVTQRTTLYDIVFLDVFVGGGEHVNHLSTVECFELYKSKLKSNGVLVANLVNIDPLVEHKIAAIESVFKHCYVWHYNGAQVIFASRNFVAPDLIKKRVYEFQDKETLEFDLVAQANLMTESANVTNVTPLFDKDL